MSEAMTPAMRAVADEMQALQSSNEALRRALEFYAERSNWKRITKVAGRDWMNGPAADDKGSRARSALFGLGEG